VSDNRGNTVSPRNIVGWVVGAKRPPSVWGKTPSGRFASHEVGVLPREV